MIVFSCVRIPDDIDPNQLVESVKIAFSDPQNADYIEKIKSRKSNESRAEGLYALLMLSSLCKMIAPNEFNNPVLCRNENGKPYFEHSKIRFSISHSKGLVACAVSDCGDVGIDIEASRVDYAQAKRISQRFLSPDEAKQIEEDPQRFNILWSITEARVKYLGISMADYIKNRVQYQNRLSKTKCHTFDCAGSSAVLCIDKKIPSREIKFLNDIFIYLEGKKEIYNFFQKKA